MFSKDQNPNNPKMKVYLSIIQDKKSQEIALPSISSRINNCVKMQAHISHKPNERPDTVCERAHAVIPMRGIRGQQSLSANHSYHY